MHENDCSISSNAELTEALVNPSVGKIHLQGHLDQLPSIRLLPGQSLVGSGPDSAGLRFASGQDGIQLTTDNHVHGLSVSTDPDRRAVFNDTSVSSLGSLRLHSLSLRGTLRILATGSVRGGHVEAHHIHIIEADARGYNVRPRGYGVEVIPGVFTLWNQHPDPLVSITADLTHLSAGQPGAPVRGSGIFVAGTDDMGGRLLIRRLETDAVYSDGGIAPGTTDRISGGVFTVSGAFVDSVLNRGPVTTYGANDMVLDNWGEVDCWTAEEKITSHGPSGIGFVNFGTVNKLHLKRTLETFGKGARGFNVYSGTVRDADFDRIVTHGDGAVGIQVSQPVGRIKVRRGILTRGGTGESLVKGEVVSLSAIALSVKVGGSVREVDISGGLVTHGPGVEPLELSGTIESLRISDGFLCAGNRIDQS